ncbi:YusU family protein [Metabacillus malikii]|uniref:DUF2573 family protein n=1 Tax=Metabacillus malikii TaxID=1504265 RepID=A0ABT9ZCK9_9BACI|nr:YusU family protein [Metabacillus malikii]MDQ0229669.1 hypothetical protein [Metabacillus malikii]
MDEEFRKQFDGLLEKYTELLLGEATEELTEKVKMWALYTHISKSMPPLAKHWNVSYPDGKAAMIKVIEEIKTMNEQHRASNSKES